jgi:hypothetical protein
LKHSTRSHNPLPYNSKLSICSACACNVPSTHLQVPELSLDHQLLTCRVRREVRLKVPSWLWRSTLAPSTMPVSGGKGWLVTYLTHRSPATFLPQLGPGAHEVSALTAHWIDRCTELSSASRRPRCEAPMVCSGTLRTSTSELSTIPASVFLEAFSNEGSTASAMHSRIRGPLPAHRNTSSGKFQR